MRILQLSSPRGLNHRHCLYPPNTLRYIGPMNRGPEALPLPGHPPDPAVRRRARQARARTRPWLRGIGLVCVLLAACTNGHGDEADQVPFTGTLATLPPPNLSRPGSSGDAGAVPPAPTIDRSGTRYDFLSPPDSSPIRMIDRDCPHSVRLSDGRALWIYCDSSMVDNGDKSKVIFFISTTAAITTPEAPLTMTEPLTDRNEPHQFLTPTSPDPCGENLHRVLWPLSTAVTTTPDHVDHVLVYFWTVCLLAGKLEPISLKDVGVAEYRYDPAHPPATGEPVRGTIVNEHLFPQEDGWPTFGRAATAFEGKVYVYRCPTTDRQTNVCAVGRVDPDRAGDPSAYEFWNGEGWGPDLQSAAAVPLPAGGFAIETSVEWVPALGVFVMAHDVIGSFDLGLRVARRPEGPWSEAARMGVEGCATFFPASCFQFEVQDQLSDSSTLGVIWYDGALRYDGKSVRLARIPIHVN